MYSDDCYMTDTERFHSQPARSPLGKPMVGDRQVTKVCDEGHWVRHILEQLLGRAGTLKIMSFCDAAFGNIPDKDHVNDMVYYTGGKLVC